MTRNHWAATLGLAMFVASADGGYAGTEARVAYSADYYFYAVRP